MSHRRVAVSGLQAVDSRLGAVLRAGLAATGNKYDSALTWADYKRLSLQHARMKELENGKEWYRDRAYVMAAARLPFRGPGLGVFSRLSRQFQDDKDIVLACVEGNAGVFLVISRALQEDPDVCDAFVASLLLAFEETESESESVRAAGDYIDRNYKWRTNTALRMAWDRARDEDSAELTGLSVREKQRLTRTMKRPPG